MILRSLGIVIVSILCCGILGLLISEASTKLLFSDIGTGSFVGSADLANSLWIVFGTLVGGAIGFFAGIVLVGSAGYSVINILTATLIFAAAKGGLVMLLIFGRLGVQGFRGDDWQRTWMLILLETISGGLMFLSSYLIVSKFFVPDLTSPK